MAAFETRTTQAESRKWSTIPATRTAPTGTPTRITSTITYTVVQACRRSLDLACRVAYEAS